MQVKELTKQYDGKTVVDSVTFAIPKGKVLSLIGPNGAGKSTVMGIISRLIARDAGLVDFEGQDIAKWKSKELSKRLAILTQSNSIQMKLTVRELVTFGRFPYSGGRTTPEEAFRTNGVIAFKDRKGRRMEIFPCDTTQYADVARRYRSALAAGPVLIDGGKVVEYTSGSSFYTRRHPRTLIGKRADGTVVMAVIDGRFKGQGDGATIAETAYIARQLGLTEALNLDGGGSSTLWTAQEGVLNHPYDNRRFDHEGERGVPNCIVVRR